jgi:hypothetical protein
VLETIAWENVALDTWSLNAGHAAEIDLFAGKDTPADHLKRSIEHQGSGHACFVVGRFVSNTTLRASGMTFFFSWVLTWFPVAGSQTENRFSFSSFCDAQPAAVVVVAVERGQFVRAVGGDEGGWRVGRWGHVSDCEGGCRATREGLEDFISKHDATHSYNIIISMYGDGAWFVRMVEGYTWH